MANTKKFGGTKKKVIPLCLGEKHGDMLMYFSKVTGRNMSDIVRSMIEKASLEDFTGPHPNAGRRID